MPPEHVTIDADAFDRFEAAGWNARAAAYDAFWGPITERTADELLSAANVGLGARILDVGSGPGRISRRAAELGASVVGIDVAPAMVELARRIHPGIEFLVGSAEELPVGDETFDGVVANFVLLHVGRQDVALREMARVLRSGGSLGLTMWDEGEANELHDMLFRAVAAVGVEPPADLPPGPPAFYPDPEFASLIRDAGFVDVRIDHLRFGVWFRDPEDMWNGMLGAGVRFPPLVNAQPPEIRAAIHEEFARLAARHQQAGGLDVPTSIQVTSATRP